jgi:hypothetical protein
MTEVQEAGFCQAPVYEDLVLVHSQRIIALHLPLLEATH